MAGLGRKVFASGDILLASEVQGFLQDQAVMVFDDDAARTAAIATPTEGMVTFRKDDNALEVFDGSVFVAVGGGSEPGLIHIKQVDTGGAVSSVSVNDCFSADFDQYKIVANLIGGEAAVRSVNLRLRVSSSDHDTNHHRRQRIQAQGTSVAGLRSSTDTSFQLIMAVDNVAECIADIEILNPFATKKTSALSHSSESVSQAGIISTLHTYGVPVDTSFTGFSLLASASTINGLIDVYGYKKG